MTRFPSPRKKSWIHTGRDVGPHPHPIPESDSFVETNVAICTRDGVSLRGDLYLPRGKGPFPAIVEVTPYGAQSLARLGNLYAARGYLFLAVDCRGRYRSEGDWEPLAHDRDDGHAILEWIARHPQCNGKVGTRGHSYSGYNQLLAAIDAPECLKAMVVGVAPGDPFYNTPFQGGCYDLNDLFWLLSMTGRVMPEDLSEIEDEDDFDEELDEDDLIDQALLSGPFENVDLQLGIYHPTFREWVAHWELDDFWKARSVLPHVARINVPILHISGWWDGNGRGSTQFFEALRRAARSEWARENQRLLMGPWDHDLRAPDCKALPKVEREHIERGAQRDPLNDEFEWFDRHLMGHPAGAGTEARVSLFLTGINEWIELGDWPDPRTRERSFYLDGARRRGHLMPTPPEREIVAELAMDPHDPTPFADPEVDAERLPFDNAAIQAERNDLLIFDTPAFEEEAHVIGPVRAEIYAAAENPDFDVVCSLYDVYPDGRSIYLTDGVMRARFRHGYDRPKLCEPGETVKLVIDLWHLGHVFRPGHRLRLQVAAAAFLRFDVNPGTGEPLASAERKVPTRLRILQGRDHPSAVHLHVVEA